ncbi:hypothetical protein ACFQV4_04475 [Streptomyces thermocarboxydus]
MVSQGLCAVAVEPGTKVTPSSYRAMPNGWKSASARTRWRNSEADMSS